MPPDPSSPAENHDYVSRRHHREERPDPATFARRLFEHLAEVRGDAKADLYLAKVIAELFELSPIALEHISDLLLADLTGELHRLGNPGREAARMVAEIQRDWTQGR